MGGKSYFCDYCRCYMKNDIKVRKTHNEGLAHTITKFTFMRRYEGKLESIRNNLYRGKFDQPLKIWLSTY